MTRETRRRARPAGGRSSSIHTRGDDTSYRPRRGRETPPPRPRDPVLAGRAPAPSEVPRAAGVLLRRALLRCLRDRGDDARPRARRLRSIEREAAALDRDRAAPRDRRDVLPTDGEGLSAGRRLLHRREGEPWNAPRTGGRRGDPERLRSH